MQIPSVENVFARAWNLLTRNWVIVVPGVVVGLAVGIVSGVFSMTQPDTYGEPTGTAMEFAYGFAGFVSTQCYTAGMAGAAWHRGTTTLGDGSRAVHDDAGNVFVAGIGILLCGIVAVLLAPITLFLSIFAFYLFTLYTIAAAVVGNRRGFDALRESFAIARARFGTTLIVGVLLGLLQLVGRVAAHVFGYTPLLGPVVAAIVAQIVVAYATLVVVGEYLVLRGAPAPPGAGVPPDF